MPDPGNKSHFGSGLCLQIISPRLNFEHWHPCTCIGSALTIFVLQPRHGFLLLRSRDPGRKPGGSCYHLATWYFQNSWFQNWFPENSAIGTDPCFVVSFTIQHWWTSWWTATQLVVDAVLIAMQSKSTTSLVTMCHYVCILSFSCHQTPRSITHGYGQLPLAMLSISHSTMVSPIGIAQPADSGMWLPQSNGMQCTACPKTWDSRERREMMTLPGCGWCCLMARFIANSYGLTDDNA